MPTITIQLPANLTNEQQRLILKYQARGRRTISYAEWPLVLSGFNILHTALVVTTAGISTFRKIYNTHVEPSFTDLYITELLKLSDVSREYFSLYARLSRDMVTHLRQVRLVRTDLPQTNLLLAYCSYFFRSFAAGYAFEVQIYRDFNQSGIIFEAHDIRDRQARRSFHDLKVSDWYGDIKTSLYFLRVGRSQRLPHDFYVTRLYVKGHPRVLHVMFRTAKIGLVWAKSLFLFNLEFRISDFGFRNENPNLRLIIRNPQSAIRNLQLQAESTYSTRFPFLNSTCTSSHVKTRSMESN